MIDKPSNWLNRKARKQNLAEIKAALVELGRDEEFSEKFQDLGFTEQWMLARDLVNLQRGKYQEWRMWGLVIVGVGTALWTMIVWLGGLR